MNRKALTKKTSRCLFYDKNFLDCYADVHWGIDAVNTVSIKISLEEEDIFGNVIFYIEEICELSCLQRCKWLILAFYSVDEEFRSFYFEIWANTINIIQIRNYLPLALKRVENDTSTGLNQNKAQII